MIIVDQGAAIEVVAMTEGIEVDAATQTARGLIDRIGRIAPGAARGQIASSAQTNRNAPIVRIVPAAAETDQARMSCFLLAKNSDNAHASQ